jgi:hypothetical protein
MLAISALVTCEDAGSVKIKVKANSSGLCPILAVELKFEVPLTQLAVASSTSSSFTRQLQATLTSASAYVKHT